MICRKKTLIRAHIIAILLVPLFAFVINHYDKDYSYKWYLLTYYSGVIVSGILWFIAYKVETIWKQDKTK